jgi:hypothetical protein
MYSKAVFTKTLATDPTERTLSRTGYFATVCAGFFSSSHHKIEKGAQKSNGRISNL